MSLQQYNHQRTDKTPAEPGHVAKPKTISDTKIRLITGGAIIGFLVIVAIGWSIFLRPNTVINNPSSVGSLTSNQTSSGSNTQTQTDSDNLWNSNLHGILALEGSHNVATGYAEDDFLPAKLVLLNPSNGNIIAQATLPSVNLKENTNGAELRLVAYGNPSIYDFNASYQYIAVQFDQASDGSQDVGYYNLANGGVVDISPKTGSSFSAQTVSDTLPSFDLNNPNLLLFQRNDQSYSYNIATGQSQPYTPPSLPPSGVNTSYNSNTSQFYDEPTAMCNYVVGYIQFEPCLLMDSAHAPMMITNDGPGNGGSICGGSLECGDGIFTNTSSSATFIPLASMQNGDAGEQESGITCNPVQWLNSNNILCDDLTTEDIGAKVLTPDGGGDSLNYYAVSNPVSLLPNNSRSNSNPVVSPDGKTVAFISSLSNTTGLYEVSSSGGQPTQIMSLPNNNSGELKLISWR